MDEMKALLPDQFERRVTQALTVLKNEYITALDSGDKLPKLSFLSFTKRFEISRSILYGKYPWVVAEIRAVFDACKAIPPRVVRKDTITSLKREILENRRAHEIRLAKAVSLSYVKHLERLGPAFREKTQLMLEKRDQALTIDDLRLQLHNQNKQIEFLMSELNKRNTKSD